jgi:hypothetical protein
VQNAGAEFLVDQDAGAVDCQRATEYVPESIVDHLLALANRAALSRRQWRVELKHATNVGVAMIEWQKIQRQVVADTHCVLSRVSASVSRRRQARAIDAVTHGLPILAKLDDAAVGERVMDHL